MKFCVINNLYKPYDRGGAERVVEITAEGLAQAGHEVVVISTRPYGAPEPSSEARIQNITIPSSYYNLGKLPVAVRLLWHIFDEIDFITGLRIFYILWQYKFDLVITNNLKGISFLTALFIKISGIKHVHQLHDIQLIHPSGLMNYQEENKIDTIWSKAYVFINRFIFLSPDVVVSPSDWLLKMHIDRGFFPKSKKIILKNPIPYGENVEIVLENREFFRFLYVGQIETHKGVLLLLEAYKKLPFEFLKRCELVIVGDGSLLKDIKQSGSNPINTNILGKQNREDILELMTSSDCLIVPSLCYENAPTVIYEALSAGLPVIASNLGGIPELLNNNPSLLFEPTVEALQNKMEWAFANQKELSDAFTSVREKERRESVEEYIEKIGALID